MRKILALLLAALMVFALIGCSSENSNSNTTDDSTNSTDTSTNDESNNSDQNDVDVTGMRLALFMASTPNETTTSFRDEAIKVAEEYGCTLEVFIGDGDQAKQVNDIETCIVQGYDGLIIEPVTADGCNKIMETAKESGIPMVTIMQDCTDPSLVYSHCGADHEGAGYLQMKEVCEAIGGQGKIAIITGQKGTTGEIQLSTGYETALSEYPDVEVVEEQDGFWMIDDALSITETWLQKYNDLDAIVAQSDQMTLGALQACKDAGITDINLTGRDANTATLEAVKAGEVYGTVSQNAYQMGANAVNSLITVIKGGSVESVIYTDNVFVTADNVDEYLK
jgi:inositol transport system substrate-binding protein